jgi:hypothetical protein
MLSFRPDSVDELLLDVMCRTLGMNQSDAIRTAIRAYVPQLVIALGLTKERSKLVEAVLRP